MSENTVIAGSIVADTIMRTVELGVTIRDAAIDGDTTVVFCELITSGPDRCPGCGTAGKYRDRIERRVVDIPVAGHPLQLRVRVPATCAPTPRAHGKCSATTLIALPDQGGPQLAAARSTSCTG